MDQVLFILSIAVLVLLTVLILIYFKFHFKYGALERLMSLNYLFIGFVYWVIHLNSTGGILSVPHLYRLGGGVWMLSLVLLYYSSRMIYFKPISWKEYLLLLPVLIYFINFIPFIFQNSESKTVIINEDLLNGLTYSFDNGWLFSGKYIILLRVFLSLLISGLIAALIFQKRKETFQSYGYTEIVNYYFWFCFLTSFPEVFSLFGLETVQGIQLHSYLYPILGIVFLLYYFYKPQLLYGLNVDLNRKNFTNGVEYEEISPNSQFKTDFDNTDLLTSRQRADILKIEFYLDHNNPCLDVNFSLGQLEKETGITAKRISQCIKLKYEMNFAQYINRRRIRYVIEKLDADKKWRNYSVEALALNVGFNSTNSFYNYFKGYTGKTPREFIDSLV